MAVEITEVRIKLMEEPGERLQAFCSITFDDCFVVRDLKIIEGSSGPFVAMPSRKLTAHCPACGCKNHLRAAHCNQCGGRLKEQHAMKDEDGRTKLYADIAHPINSACREMIQARVIRAFEDEKSRSKMPDYVPQDYDDYDTTDELEPMPAPTTTTVSTAPPALPVEMPAAMPASPLASAELQGPQQPRGPHRAPARPPHTADRPANAAFGAGIFE